MWEIYGHGPVVDSVLSVVFIINVVFVKALECQEKAPSEEGLGYKVVLKLTKNVPAGSLVVFDNFFTSIPLIEILYERNIYSVGTVRLTRKGMPEESTSKKSGYSEEMKMKKKEQMKLAVKL
ncbi:unnamed protein product [Parnassius apollo]|uniref:(apollo) hypothetical protein n=1 Tax=Parnassius apollo TaxID=110799 RepID=A0A8S3X834_PARAO|nr:unnamed protein product [Parnassius apollo]